MDLSSLQTWMERRASNGGRANMKNYLFGILTLTLVLGCGGGDTPNEVENGVTQDTSEPRVTLDLGQPDSMSERDLADDPAGPLDITYTDDGLIQEVAPRDTAGEFGSFCQVTMTAFLASVSLARLVTYVR